MTGNRYLCYALHSAPVLTYTSVRTVIINGRINTQHGAVLQSDRNDPNDRFVSLFWLVQNTPHDLAMTSSRSRHALGLNIGLMWP